MLKMHLLEFKKPSIKLTPSKFYALETLEEKLNYTKAYRQTRLDVAQWVLDRPESIQELIDFCFHTEDAISYKAAWILEFVCDAQLELLLPHLDYYLENLPKIHKDQALRPMAKVLQFLAIAYYKTKDPKVTKSLTRAHKEQIISCSFDWLITDQKVACKVYGMTALVHLGTEFEWIHPELKTIIEQHIHDALPAYKARGKYVLNRIRIFEKRKK